MHMNENLECTCLVSHHLFKQISEEEEKEAWWSCFFF